MLYIPNRWQAVSTLAFWNTGTGCPESDGCPIAGYIQDQAGLGLEQSDLIKAVPASLQGGESD